MSLELLRKLKRCTTARSFTASHWELKIALTHYMGKIRLAGEVSIRSYPKVVDMQNN
ncbi:hypothetical protein C8N28_2699 [Albibacterium bauzanense]|uniref:Uncharacterized protein n=1 Tax=Albibacterium bauzanense TaxID=653929 RepID=A0A4R1LQ96_9SPHI|nr:hypothetical protein C8N28_2699 [Albibacterium bauzanense]